MLPVDAAPRSPLFEIHECRLAVILLIPRVSTSTNAPNISRCYSDSLTSPYISIPRRTNRTGTSPISRTDIVNSTPAILRFSTRLLPSLESLLLAHLSETLAVMHPIDDQPNAVLGKQLATAHSSERISYQGSRESLQKKGNKCLDLGPGSASGHLRCFPPCCQSSLGG